MARAVPRRGPCPSGLRLRCRVGRRVAGGVSRWVLAAPKGFRRVHVLQACALGVAQSGVEGCLAGPTQISGVGLTEFCRVWSGRFALQFNWSSQPYTCPEGSGPAGSGDTRRTSPPIPERHAVEVGGADEHQLAAGDAQPLLPQLRGGCVGGSVQTTGKKQSNAEASGSATPALDQPREAGTSFVRWPMGYQPLNKRSTKPAAQGQGLPETQSSVAAAPFPQGGRTTGTHLEAAPRRLPRASGHPWRPGHEQPVGAQLPARWL